MTAFNYGGRFGVSTIIFLTIKLCDIYQLNITKIKDFIDGVSGITTDQKNTVKDWLDGANAACTVLKIIKVAYER